MPKLFQKNTSLVPPCPLMWPSPSLADLKPNTSKIGISLSHPSLSPNQTHPN
uniref:Uncharacterized protein n=1 Tax=Arundo donax TaxID=35708 RepID=A0A0A9FBH6_ARUDO